MEEITEIVKNTQNTQEYYYFFLKLYLTYTFFLSRKRTTNVDSALALQTTTFVIFLIMTGV